MPRPRKCRRVCSHPVYSSFGAFSCDGKQDAIVMSVDEFESIRLIDFEELTQGQCAERMDVARTTVQAIYQSARKKLAEAVVQGSPLHIEGGNVRFCEHRSSACGEGCCKWRNKQKMEEGK